jgi:hypothetical protein
MGPQLGHQAIRECDPGIPSIGAVLRGKFLVAFDIEVTFCGGTQRNDKPDLGADADHLRLEAADSIAGAAVATDLFVNIAAVARSSLFSAARRLGRWRREKSGGSPRRRQGWLRALMIAAKLFR